MIRNPEALKTSSSTRRIVAMLALDTKNIAGLLQLGTIWNPLA